jgi:Uma2 family endonuclease
MHADTIAEARPSAPADPPVAREELVRLWNARPFEEDSPVLYELSEFGEWIVTPRPTHEHQHVEFTVAVQLNTQLGPRAVTEVSVLTDRGIRAPDVVWMPAARWLEVKGQNPLPFAPDVCVEVLSPSNTREEIQMKVGAYLRGGAREAIVVGLKGQVEFFGPEGKLEASALGIRLELPADLF